MIKYSTSSNRVGPSQTDYVAVNKDGSWNNSFGPSMNAVSYGFVATAILIAMFLVMAIFEHLFGPKDEPSRIGSRQMHKLETPDIVQTSHASSDFSVVMPGQQYPTFIAKPAPMPCQREGINLPPHQHSNIV
ncbi:hypothetical protein OROHE_019010 [Orobanche hederae]